MMINKIRLSLLSTALGTLAAFGLQTGSPVPAILSPLDEGYLERARAFLRAENWQGATDQLERLYISPTCAYSDLSGEESQDAAFIAASAACRSGNPNGMVLIRQFIADYPASPLLTDAKIIIADALFFKGEYQAAMRAYDDINPDMLTGDQAREYIYRKALCMLKSGYSDESRPLFLSLRNYPQYHNASLFYDAYIDYAQGDLDNALNKFKKVPSTGERGLEADYYITQIMFSKGEYNDVISESRRLLQSNPPQELLPETLRVYGLSLFKLGNKSESETILRNYMDITGDSAAASAVYALGTVYYDKGDYVSAADLFGRLTDDRNEIAQSAWLYLGQIALQNNDDNTAAISFDKAANMSFDHNVSETALYNYATAASRGGGLPFRSGITLLEQFNESFPRSRYQADVDEYLAAAYFNTKDYERALTSISKISNPSESVRKARQKILYEVGMQRLVNGNPEGAAKALAEAVSSNADAAVAAQSNLWLGDARYTLKDYTGAVKAYSAALKSGRLGNTNKGLATYNLGYALQKLSRFNEALTYFRQAASDSGLSKGMQRDAEMRVADCLYYTGKYDAAISAFSRLGDAGGADTEYAVMREATLLGRKGDVEGKIKLLKRLADNTPPDSRWLPEILERLATAYSEKGDDPKAAAVYEKYLSIYPSGKKAATNSLALSRAYGKSGQSVKSELEYKKVIETWPTSEEARQADTELRRIFASEGRLDEYAAYLRKAPGGFSIDANEIEHLSFEAAEDAWNDNGATKLIDDYLTRYPNGAFADAAWYMKAETLHEKGERPKALEAYRKLLSFGPGEYYLAAQTGIMRNSDSDKEVRKAAEIIKTASGAGAELSEEAEFYEAYSLSTSSNATEKTHALSLLSSIAENPNSLWGARAAVTLGQAYLNSSRPAKAEKVLLDFVDSGTPHQYWLARGYIALADAYTALGKGYLANQYLESLRENYPGDDSDIQNMISSRLK